MSDAEVVVMLSTWADAEGSADWETLERISLPDFALVGPAGFVLAKTEWLDRFRSRELTTDGVKYDLDLLRTWDAVALAIGTVEQHASHRGRRVDGVFRSTHVFARRVDAWLIAGIHLSPWVAGQVERRER